MPNLFRLDARAILAIGLWALHMREWTFFVALAVMVFLFVAGWFHVSPEVLLRRTRSKLVGRRRPACMPTELRRAALRRV